jgi:hypothetical protein
MLLETGTPKEGADKAVICFRLQPVEVEFHCDERGVPPETLHYEIQ